ncbi:hypothetical protein [Streptomyces bluensis]|uniref:Phage tail tape measure protein domain-containing protein n=1 Tax=Streptomyces bluensis TaxID=33897 RepID=A0ABW6UU89_9ACTN
MSEWNLSVRLTGQGTSARRMLRDTARDARAASRDVAALRRDISRLRQEARRPIRIQVRADARQLRSDVRAALTTAGTGQGITARLDVDAAHLRADVQAALTAAGAGQGMRVDLALGNAMQLRRDVENAVRWAAWGHRIEIPLVLADRMQLRRDVTDAVRWAQMNQTIRVRVQADTSSLGGLTRTLTRGGSSGGGGGAQGMLRGLLMLAPAAIPLLAGLSNNLAPLAGQFAAAGVQGAAFGIALAGQIGPLGEAADAEKKYQEAVLQHGRTSKQAMEAQLAYQQRLAALPPDTQRAAIALSQLKGTFTDWSDSMSRFTMEPVTHGITVLEQLIPRLTPHVVSASTQLDRLVTVAGGAVQTPGFDAMANRFADFSDRQLEEMTSRVIHFLRVLSEGGAITSGPLAEFMAYARENGPAAREAISAISDAVVTLMRGAAEAGPSILTLVTAAARLVAALPPELVGIILQVATALKLLQLSGAGMAALAGGLATVRTQIAALTATSAAAGGGLAGLRAAFLALGTAAKASIVVAGIAAVVLVLKGLSDIGKEAPPDVDKLTTSLGKLGQTGKVTGEALRSFGPDLKGLGDSLRTLARPSNLDKFQQTLTKLVGMDSTPVKEAKKDLDAVDKSLANLVRGGKGEVAAAAFERVAEAMRKQGMSGKELKGQLDDYKSAMADHAFEQELAAQSMGVFGQAAQDTTAKLDAQKQSADGLRQSIQALSDVNRAAGSAMSAFEQSIDDATEAVKDHAGVLKMRDGELDLGTEKSREAEKVLNDLAGNTHAAAAAAREQGKSWEYVSGIYSKGRQAFIDAADSMGLTRAQAEALAAEYLKIPDKKSTVLEMRTEDAIAGLNAVIGAIKKTPDAKSVTVKALTQDAITMLEDLGFKVTKLKDGRFRVTAETGTATDGLANVQRLRDGLKNKTIKIDAQTQQTINDLEEVKKKVASTKGKTITMRAPTAEAREQLEQLGFRIKSTKGKTVTISVPTGGPKASVADIQAAINSLHGKTVTNTVTTLHKNQFYNVPLMKRDGGLVDYYADGGIQRGGVRHFAGGAEQHVAQIAPAGSWRVWAEPETGGEAYVPLSRSKRPRSRRIVEETVRRLGGNPAAIEWNADGNVTDWRYDPSTGSLYSASDAGSAGKKTKKVKVKGKWKEVEYFDVTAVEKKLKSAAKATQAWNKDLEKVADRVGGDVAEALASMGKDGVALAKKMANGSTKYIEQMAKALRDLQKTAKASLTDYTRELDKANKLDATFAKNLADLAAQGYGDLAKQLAAQNDQAAMGLAAAAVKDKGKASKANAAAKTANNALTADQVEQLVAIIAAVTSSKTGIHDVAATTGLGEDEIIAVANKATSQIKSSLGSRASRFLADLAKANKGLAYADGGIRSGIYATRGGMVTFAEPSTGGEAYIPLGANKRRSALPVLSDVAGRFGLGLKAANEGRIVIIREQGPLVGQQTFHVTSGGDAVATARKVDADNAYQLRRLARGGVGARG